jgi:hypothetical protein
MSLEEPNSESGSAVVIISGRLTDRNGWSGRHYSPLFT